MTVQEYFARAELERLPYRSQRMVILERLQKFIKQVAPEEREPDYFIQPTGPLAKYLR